MNFVINKKLILFVVAVFSLRTINAQVRFGEKAGLNMTNVSVSHDFGRNTYAMKPDFHVGAFVSIPGCKTFLPTGDLLRTKFTRSAYFISSAKARKNRPYQRRMAAID